MEDCGRKKGRKRVRVQGRIQKMNFEGANSGGLGTEVPQRGQGRSPGRGSGGRSPPEADDFSQLKGYLDVTSGILGGMAPWPPLNPPVCVCAA